MAGTGTYLSLALPFASLIQSASYTVPPYSIEPCPLLFHPPPHAANQTKPNPKTR